MLNHDNYENVYQNTHFLFRNCDLKVKFYFYNGAYSCVNFLYENDLKNVIFMATK